MLDRGEPLDGQGSTEACPNLVGDLRGATVAALVVPDSEPSGKLGLEQGDVRVRLPKGRPETYGLAPLLVRRVRIEGRQSLGGEGMLALTEEEGHLLGSHRVALGQPVDAREPRPDPDSRCLALLVVVVGQG